MFKQLVLKNGQINVKNLAEFAAKIAEVRMTIFWVLNVIELIWQNLFWLKRNEASYVSQEKLSLINSTHSNSSLCLIYVVPDSLEQRSLVPVFPRLFAMFHKCYGRRTRGGTAWEIGWRNLDPALFRVEVLQHVNEKVKLDLLAETCSKLFAFCWTWNNYLFQGEENGDI